MLCKWAFRQQLLLKRHLKPKQYTEQQSVNGYIYIEIYGFSDYSNVGNVEYVYS